MASINVGNNSSNMYRVGDYVYFEVQQSGIHQPFQIRRIEELNKTANGNIEVKVMCFYRRRDLPAQLVDLADKHQQQQLLLTLSLSPGESSVKDCGKQIVAVKTRTATDKNIPSDKKEQRQVFVDEHTNSKIETSDVTDSIKEEEKQNDVTEAMETDLVASAAVKSAGDENDDTNDKFLDNEKTTKSTHDWWRGEQLKQRELFLSRQVETLAATHIRGKCTVTLYNETESLDSYLEREDTFFYCLVFDPVQKTLLADKGEIRVGNKYQAEIPSKALCNSGNYIDMAKDLTAVIKNECLSTSGDDPMDTEYTRDVKPKSSSTITTVESDSEFETLMWTCNPQWNSLTDRQIDQFLVVSRSLGTFARALDCTSSVKQPSLHMSAAAASRDITLFHAMDTLHRHGYDFGIATCSLVPSTGPVLCRDEMEEWSASEANLFEEALEKYGKDFGDIRHDFLPWKTHKNIVEYYYMWKTTDRYVQQKRVKAVEQENKLKHVYIPSNNGTIKNVGKQQTLTSPSMMKSSQLVNGNSSAVELYSKNSGLSSTDGQLLSGVCDLCDVVASQQWYPNTIGITSISNHQQNGVVSSTLCHACWNHFKKYGGSRTATSDKKIIGHSIFGDEDHPISNASSGSAMNLNVLASSRPSAQIQTQMSTTPHHLMHLGNLHQPQINPFGSSTTTHRCTIIGCQAPSYKNKTQLLRHYSIAHGIGINSNNSTSTPIITSISGGVDSSNTISSPQPVQQQTVGLLHHSSGSPLNLNYSNNSIPHSNTVPGTVNQVINLVASSPQVQSNSLSSVATNSAIGTVSAVTATGRPVMKTRTAFYLRCTSLAKASRRRAVQRAISLLQDNVTKCSSSDNSIINPILSTSVQPCLARPRNVARRPFVCVPQAAHTYKHECMLSMQNAPIHELRSYLKAASIKTHARRPGVTRVANTLIAARKGHGATAVSDLTIPDWLFLPSQQHHHISSSSANSKQGKHSSSRLSTGRIAFPKPPKAPDGSLLYERVPNKLEAVAIGLNPTAPPITGALRQPGGSVNSNSVSPNDPSAPGFDVAATTAAICQQQQSDTSSSGNKRRLYESDNAAEQHQPKPQAGPPSKRMHRHHLAQHQQPSIQGGNNGSSGGAVDSLLATLSSGPSQLNKSRSQMHQHYRTPSMARTGRKHVISWTDAPDDLYYRCTTLSKSLRKTRMTSKDLKRSARKPWQPISALLGISFTMPSSSSSAVPLATGCTFGLQPSVASPFDMSITGNGCASNNRQSLNQSGLNIVQPNVAQSLLSRTSSNTGHH